MHMSSSEFSIFIQSSLTSNCSHEFPQGNEMLLQQMKEILVLYMRIHVPCPIFFHKAVSPKDALLDRFIDIVRTFDCTASAEMYKA